VKLLLTVRNVLMGFVGFIGFVILINLIYFLSYLVIPCMPGDGPFICSNQSLQ